MVSKQKLSISPKQWKRIVEAAEVSTFARSLTHSLYRYPAAMSPQIVNSVIRELTQPGEIVLDPFCGGGTTAVEALANGRLAICSDLNSMACFVTKCKANPLSEANLSKLGEWVEKIRNPKHSLSIIKPTPLITTDGKRYVPHSHGLLLALRDSTYSLHDISVRRLAQLIVLRTGQICFDCRQVKVNPRVVSDVFKSVAGETLLKAKEFANRVQRNSLIRRKTRHLRVLRADAESLGKRLGDKLRSVSLVLTSPPYPGTHVLYHRWQFRGRKEIPLPYQILNLNDGGGESYYTLGSRHEQGNLRYFSRLGRIFSGFNQALRPGTFIVQVVSFSNPNWQCKQYLDEMSKAGLVHITSPILKQCYVSRNIPNRKWYIRTKAVQGERREHIFIHQSRG